MEYTTGLPTPKFADLLIRLREERVEGYPPSMGLRNALKAALIYMRHNIPQVVIGEQLNVSQSTVSRAVGALTDAIARALKDLLLTAEEVPEGCDFCLDGTLFPCWSRRNHRELWSGKHGTTGMNVQILVLPSGRLVWASDPYPGSMHDVAALDASGLLDGIDPSGWIADKGYIGRGMITPHKKPPNGELSEAAEEANKSINRIRQAERANHRPHQVLENPPHRLPPPPAHIRTDHHRRTLTLRLQNCPLNKLHRQPVPIGCAEPPGSDRCRASGPGSKYIRARQCPPRHRGRDPRHRLGDPQRSRLRAAPPKPTPAGSKAPRTPTRPASLRRDEARRGARGGKRWLPHTFSTPPPPRPLGEWRNDAVHRMAGPAGRP